jgi:ferric-dicitrate binding protein FerR (iron transport regulator)
MVEISDDMLERFIRAAELNAESNARSAIIQARMEQYLERGEERDSRNTRVLRHVARVLKITEDSANKGREMAVKQVAAIIEAKLSKRENRRDSILLVIAILTAVALIVKAIEPENLWKHFIG